MSLPTTTIINALRAIAHTYADEDIPAPVAQAFAEAVGTNLQIDVSPFLNLIYVGPAVDFHHETHAERLEADEAREAIEAARSGAGAGPIQPGPLYSEQPDPDWISHAIASAAISRMMGDR